MAKGSLRSDNRTVRQPIHSRIGYGETWRRPITCLHWNRDGVLDGEDREWMGLCERYGEVRAIFNGTGLRSVLATGE